MSNNLYEYAAPGPGRDIQTGNAKMQGYGNYVFKAEFTLYNFIQYCYALNPSITTECCIYTGSNDANSYEYTKLCTFSGQALTSNAKTFVDNFWTKMVGTLGELFNQYQDLYYFEKYTNKGACLVFTPNKYSDEKGKEFLTAMTSYIFSTNQNSAPNCEIKKGDIIPFLYVKEQDEVDDNIKNSPKELTKYAYLACINGWSESASNDLWYEEYKAIFGDYDEEKLCEEIGESLEELEVWYMETFEKYQNERGKSGNALLGATIDTIIKSDYSIGQQVEAVDYYLKNIEGIDDYKENMARNELMAKYMMENSHIGDMIKDYNFGINFITENLQRGTQEDKNTSTVVLSDFQVLELNHTLDKDGQSDSDGLSDLTELTTNTKWVNITGPITKMYNDMISKGNTTKTFEEEIEDLAIKNGKYNDLNGNIVWGHLKYEGGKVYYKTRDYNSNPKLNDTDVDGLWDNIDKKPINNYIVANIDIDKNSSFNMTYGSDYRYFFIKNTKFNNELAEMSLVMANLSSNNRKINIDQDNSGNLSINNYMSELGFTLLDTINLYGGKGKCYIGKKEIQYYDVKKYVYGIFVGGFTDEASYKNLLFATDGIEDVFKEMANVIVDKVEAYAKPDNYCYWITGLNIAGGVANLVACELNTDETYAYVFGPPNISKDSGAYPYIKNIINADDIISKIYSEDEGYHINGAKYYKSIKYDMKKEYRQYVGNFNKYNGDYKVTNKSKNDIKKNKDEYSSSPQYNDMINMTNQLLFSDSIIGTTGDYLLCRNDDGTVYAMSFTDIFGDIYSFFKNIITSIFNNKSKVVSDGQSFKAYDVEVKSLDGFDENTNSEKYSEAQDGGGSSENVDDTQNYTDIVSSIEKSAIFYINNVATYQRELKSGGNEKRARETNIARNHLKPFLNELSKTPNTKQELEDKKILYTFTNETDKVNSNEVIFIDNIEKREMEPNTDKTKDIYKDGEHLWYDWTNDISHNINESKLGAISHTRDDCSGFAKLVTVLVNEGKDINISGSEYIDNPADQVSKSLLKNEYEMYYLNEESKRWYKLVKPESDDSEKEKARGFKILPDEVNMSINFLKPGDMLVCKDHVEFYVGYDYNNLHFNDESYENDDESDNEIRNHWKKSGIKTLGESKEIGISDRASGTFGWGGVNDEFPVESKQGVKHYFYKAPNEEYIRHCECGRDPTKPDQHDNCNFRTREYKVIWRKD